MNIFKKIKSLFCSDTKEETVKREEPVEIELPEIELPEIELPEIELPEIKEDTILMKLPIDEKTFLRLYPKAIGVYAQLLKHASKYGIDKPQRFAAFVAQCSHESGKFSTTIENLNYSESALNTVFHKYFEGAGRSAHQFARKPEAIANVVYANRMGNGSQASGDGWKHRGRGYIQLTGKNNYASFSKDTGIDVLTNPDIIQNNPELCLLTALWYWDKNNLNRFVDNNDFNGLTKAINGGFNGLADRQDQFYKLNKEIDAANQV